MNRIKQNKSESEFRNFIEYRKGLSGAEQKIEAGKLIEEAGFVDLEKGWKAVHHKIEHRYTRSRIVTTFTRIAAVLTLPLLLFTIWSLFIKPGNQNDRFAGKNITWQQVQSPRGMRSQVVLPDGTNLWLNAGSIVKYSIPFTRENREVKLSGEAYFDVAKNEQSPFVVKTGNAEVEVLGTQFNVNAWPDTEKLQVALKEGKVKFRFTSGDGTLQSRELHPNELLEFNKKDKTVSSQNTNIEKYIAWHQNVMILDDTPMTELAGLLEQWYGVKVIIADEEIKRYKFTTTFDNEPLHRVLELLEISSPGINIRYTLGKPIEGTKKFSPSVVTITKK